MPKVKFVGLFLLSQSERRGLKIPFNASKIVIQGRNGFGKSAIIKSIYEALGAQPQKIDRRWKNANVSSALVFEYEGERFTAVKALGTYALFDAERRILFSGRQIVKEWGPQLAEFFGFRLTMTDRDGEVVTPPPSYMVAPFYVDQDHGWNRPWASFQDLYLPESARTLADYHSGLRPDAYYAAKTGLATDRIELNGLEVSMRTLRDAITQIQDIERTASPIYDLSEFRNEVEDLVKESEILLRQQREFRRNISDLHEEAHLLGAEKSLLESALKEMRGEFEIAAKLPDEIECPTCGETYTNGVADRFALIADEGVLIEAIGAASTKLSRVQVRESDMQTKLQLIEKSLSRIDNILAVERAALSFGDVVIAAGKTEAAKILRSSLVEKGNAVAIVEKRIAGHKKTMNDLSSPKRSAEINNFYRQHLSSYAHELDVTLDGGRTQYLNGIHAARGSEGPRGLLAYYYAFLKTKERFTESTFFPIVIDAPNQQGQDAVHLPQMLKFIFRRAPTDSQVIVATEDAGRDLPADIQIQQFGERRHQVLREAEYKAISEGFAPYLNQMITD